MRFQRNGKLSGSLFVPAHPVVLLFALDGSAVFEIRQTFEPLWFARQLDVYGVIVEVLNNQRVIVV